MEINVPFPLRRKRLVFGLLLAFLIATVSSAAFSLNLFHGLQLRGRDLLFRPAYLNAKTDTSKDIAIITIDDESLSQLGHLLSWPRSYHARLIDILSDAEARVIAFDMLFTESAPGDEQMAASMRRAGNVVLPIAYTMMVKRSAVSGEASIFRDFLRPITTLEQNATAVGHANMLPDQDGIVRRLPILISSNEHHEPALSLATVASYLRRPQTIESPPEDNFLALAGRSIPIDSDENMLINYLSDSAAPLRFETFSYANVLSSNVNPSVFRDKIVIIGVTALGLGDTFWTPIGRLTNGVELHSYAMHTILAGNFLQPLPDISTIMLIFLLAFLAGASVLCLRTTWATSVTVLVCIFYFLFAFTMFDYGIIVNMLYPPLATVGTFVVMNLHRVTMEHAEKMEITRTFGRYIPPPVMGKILATLGPGGLRTGGEQREATVAFADIRGFTSITEKLPSAELMKALNTYLSVIIEAVLKYDGIINKFGGDSVMAIWNVPVACEGHALRAVKTALRAQRAIRLLQEQDITLPKMEFGISVNTGEVVAGNIGSRDRLEYSVVGDAVNYAARLADAVPGGKVWIGDNTYRQVKNSITVTPLEPFSVKGKSEPITAYEVIDLQHGPAEDQEQSPEFLNGE
ncbi:CHASE2 domain-containing protein [Chloroflexota bacterium]